MRMTDKVETKDKATAGLSMNCKAFDDLEIGGEFTIECFKPDGNLRWTNSGHNLFVTVGLNEILDVVFGGGATASGIYVGLMDDGGAPVAGDTMASQTNWAEAVPYNESVRQTYTVNGAATGGAVSNSSSKATFSINATDTVDGAFLVDDDTKGGSAGTLFCAIEFAAGRDVYDGDSLVVQYDLSIADS